MAKSRRDKEKQKRRKSNALQWAKEQDKQSGGGCFKLPDGVEQFKLEAGVQKFDVMPFIAGEGNPSADEGMIHFERTYDMHRIPVAGGSMKYVACRAHVFKEKCAVCNWIRKNGGTADQDLVKSLKASTRHIWLINDTPGKLKKWKVMETNHWNKGKGFGEMMVELISLSEENADFSDLENGLTVQVKAKEETFPGGKYIMPTRIDFLPRKYAYPDELLDEAPCLDSMLIDPGYDEVMALLDTGEDGGEDDDVPARKSRKPDPDEDEDSEDTEDSDEDEDEEDLTPSKKKAPPKKSRKPDPDEDEDEPEEPSDLEEDEDEDEPEEPSDLEDDEDEDEPPVKKKAPQKKRK